MGQIVNVIGISEEHDAGAAYVEGSGLKIASNEERYSRKKFQSGFPSQSLKFILDSLKQRNEKPPKIIAVSSIFHVDNALGDWFNLNWKYELLERFFSFFRLDWLIWGHRVGPILVKTLGLMQRPFRKRRIQRSLADLGLADCDLRFVDHHTCHAAAAAATSGWNDCMVITQDASGDGICSRVFLVKDGKLEAKSYVPFFHSPGHYYEYVTHIFGFKPGREGKVTGLAAYGNPDLTYPIFEKELSYDAAKKAYVNHALYRKAEIKRLKGLLKNFSREDIAAGVQKHLEVNMTSYIRDMIRSFALTKSVKLAVAGGVFANVKLNQRIAALTEVESLFVYPHMADGGLAAGAAFYLALEYGVKPEKLPGVYIGDDITEEDILEALRVYGDKLQVERPERMDEAIAEHLAQGRVVALVQGRMEYGPRALGHRTLLYQTTDPTVNDWLNKRLRRSEFMPFAPILRAEDLGEYFSDWEKVLPSLPYMTVTVNCMERCKKEAPAIVHVDGSARPQIVYKENEPMVHDILTAYAKRTGLKILVNTSFNIHEEPIVRTASDAVKTFLDGHIDVLILNDRLITLKAG